MICLKLIDLTYYYHTKIFSSNLIKVQFKHDKNALKVQFVHLKFFLYHNLHKLKNVLLKKNTESKQYNYI